MPAIGILILWLLTAPAASPDRAFARDLLRELVEIDSAPVRRAGIPPFGVSGTFSDELGNAHGANERLGVVEFDQSVDFLYRLLTFLTAGDK